MQLKHICFIVEDYPFLEETNYTFVAQTIRSIADLGFKCSVIAPQSISNTLLRKRIFRPLQWVDKSANNKEIDIFQPKYISFSNVKLGGINLTQYSWDKSIIKFFNKKAWYPDVFYCHFWHSGIVAAKLKEKVNIPVFIATGESIISVKKRYSEKILSKYMAKIDGVICVSTKNMQESLNLKLVPKEKMVIIPNAVDDKLFYPINKMKVRKMLGIRENDFIVAYTGAFIHRKGVVRLSSALNKIEAVKAIYIGSGSQKPTGDNILFCGKLPHHKIVYYLNAADVFVLPTLAEGCSNAIIEAMACGLPIISSNLPFNDDILNSENSIRIDSNNIDEIANAIKYIKDNPQKRKKMSDASLAKARELNLKERAKRIIKFISSAKKQIKWCERSF